MNNLELFIKYADNNLSADEKVNLEIRLAANENLRNEYNQFLTTYKSLNNNTALDERYFTSLLPKVKNRIIEKKNVESKFFGISKLAYSIPILILIAVIFFNLFSSTNKINNQLNFEKLYTMLTADSNMTRELFDNAVNVDNNFSLDQNIYSAIYNEDDYDDLLFKYAQENSQSIEINDSLFNQLSENDYDLVYNKLISKNIL